MKKIIHHRRGRDKLNLNSKNHERHQSSHGKPQPKMKEASIERGKRRGKDGILHDYVISKQKTMDKEEFITRRTQIISEMLDNQDETTGICPTGKCFEQLDKLFDELQPQVEQIAKTCHEVNNEKG